jgi:hypothetical protein
MRIVALHGDDVTQAFVPNSRERTLATLDGFASALASKGNTTVDNVTLSRPDVTFDWTLGRCAPNLRALLPNNPRCAKISVVAFSRGTVALTRALAEMLQQNDQTSLAGVSVFYLDGGTAFPDAERAYLDSDSASKLDSLNLRRICVEGTPRQWHDPQRPCLAKQKDEMVSGLARCWSVSTAEKLHMHDACGSLATHMRCIDAFEFS